MKFPPFHPTSFNKTVYRSIFTNASGEHILDDICDAEDYSLVSKLIQITSGIDHSQPPLNRPFQYATIEDDDILAVFKKENWNTGRFGDGTSYGVWYSALDQETSIYESAWVAYRLAKDNVLSKNEVYCNERAMYSAHINSEKMIDLSKVDKSIHAQLVHPRDYSYCQGLGKKIVAAHHHVLATPSARKVSGLCTPLFSPEPIWQTQRIYYLKINVYPDGSIGVNSSQINCLLQAEDLAAPYARNKK